MTQISIFDETQQGKEFYSQLGPFFADKMFFKLFGEPLYNEPNSVWFVAYKDDTILGFCAAFKKKTHVYFNQFYVTDEYKGRKIGTLLFKARMDYFKNQNVELRAMVRDERSLHLYSKNKFQEYGNRGSYKLVKLEMS